MKETRQSKQHQTPEFTVIRQNESNQKFFVASGGLASSAPASTYSVGSTSAW